jgi:preprotein translocase subunit SecF
VFISGRRQANFVRTSLVGVVVAGSSSWLLAAGPLLALGLEGH